MVAAQKAAEDVQDLELRDSLLTRINYLQGGAAGPDIFYFPPSTFGIWTGPPAYAYSDYAHYCRTDELANNMLSLAGHFPKLQAFAFGWLAHVAEDSTAHPWVNGFLGGPFTEFYGLNGNRHGHIEAWVNGQIISQEGLSDADIYNALSVYYDQDVQDLLIEAYDKTYKGKTDCSGKPVYKSLDRDTVSRAAANAQNLCSWNRCEVWSDLPAGSLLFPAPNSRLIEATYAHYFDLSALYTGLVWNQPGLLTDINLDQGIDVGRQALQDLYSIKLVPLQIFPTPWNAYVQSPFGGKPQYDPKCESVTAKPECSPSPKPTNPGGGVPDDNVSAGSATALSPVLNEASFARLAIKHERAWPAFVSDLNRMTDQARSQIAAGDEAAFNVTIARLQATFRQRAADSTFLGLYGGSRGADPRILDATDDVALLDNGFVDQGETAVEGFQEPVQRIAPGDLSGTTYAQHPILFIPSGGLYGLTQNQQFASGLAEYVSAGGTAVVFDQQRGSDWGVLPTPNGQPIQGWGWYEDQDCYWNAAYVDTFHPLLASQSQALVTSSVDGYFTSIPDNAIVLLRRVKNGSPVMFMYPYGQGWVIVSASYDDWNGYGQSGSGAQGIIRDAIAWAKKPGDLPLNLRGSTAAVTLNVKNVGDVAASQVHLILMSPSRDRKVAERTVALTLAGGTNGQVPFSYAIPAYAELGIYHLDYELLDESGVVVQPAAEDDNGRIVVASPPPPGQYRPADLTFSVTASGGEQVLWDGPDSPIPFHYKLDNRSDHQRHFRVWWDVDHGPRTLAAEMEVQANTSVEGDMPVTAQWPGFRALNAVVYEVGGTPRVAPWWWVGIPGETAAFQLMERKGFTAIQTSGLLAVRTDNTAHGPGETAQLTATLSNTVAFPWSAALTLACGFPGEPPAFQAEQPVSFVANGSATVSFSVPIPPRPAARAYSGQWSEACTATVLRNGHTIAKGGAGLVIQAATLGAFNLNTPPWSPVDANPVTWTLRNISQRDLFGGTVHADLVDQTEAVVWEESQSFDLVAGAQLDVHFTAPPLPPGFRWGRIEVSADNGLSKEQGGSVVAASARLWSSLAISATASKSSFAAGDSGEIVVELRSGGTVMSVGSVAGSINGLATLTPQAYSLLPGQTALVRLPFQVPVDAVSGLYRAELAVPGIGTSVPFSVAPPVLSFSVEDVVYRAGDSVPVTLRNTGGVRSPVHVTLTLRETPVTSDEVVEPGGGTVLNVPLPGTLPTGTTTVSYAALDSVNYVVASGVLHFQVSGTQASLSVSMDKDVYARYDTATASAHVGNEGVNLGDAVLHLEAHTTCIVQQRSGGSYHFDTWNGSAWVERAVRDRAPILETDLVDLVAYLPDPDGEYKVRIRQTGTFPATMDQIALVSNGTLVPPDSAVFQDYGYDDHWALQYADGWLAYVDGQTIVAHFPAAPGPSLLYLASEGEADCQPFVMWQKDFPLSLGPGESLDLSDTFSAWDLGQFTLTGTLMTRNGDRLGVADKAFKIVDGQADVSITTDAELYRAGAPIQVSGTVTNLSDADLNLQLSVTATTLDFDGREVFNLPISLPAGTSQDYAFTLDPSTADLAGYDAVSLKAWVLDLTTPYYSPLAEADRTFRAGSPRMDVRLSVPDPPVQIVTTREQLVSAEDGDLDDRVHGRFDQLLGTFPFPVSLGGVTYTSFRQSTGGFLELVPEGGDPRWAWPSCLTDANAMPLIAPFLGDINSASQGFVGYKFYAAGSQDRAGRTFGTDTMVFFWTAPAPGSTPPNTFQALVTRDGLIRMDGDATSLDTSCTRTGVVLPDGSSFSYTGPTPFGLRVENGVDPGPFTGGVHVSNSGTFPGTVTLDYGRDGGDRTNETLTLAPKESHTFAFSDALSEPTTYTLTATGDADLSLQQTVAPQGSLVVSYGGAVRLSLGPTMLPVVITKTGSRALSTDVTFTLSTAAGDQTVTRSYVLEPDVPVADAIPFVLPEGPATLVAESASGPLSMEPVALLGAADTRVTFTASAGEPTQGIVPISADIANGGLLDFAGELEIDGPGGSGQTLSVVAGASLHVDAQVDLALAPPGDNLYTIRLVSADGTVVGETSFSEDVKGPEVQIVSSPAGQSFDSGQAITLPFVLHNSGSQAAIGTFSFGFFDQSQTRTFELAPGADVEMDLGFVLETDSDEKTFSGTYTIQTGGAPAVTGQINFDVKGISLAVHGTLDKAAYADGDTAHFTVEIENNRPAVGTDYLVRARYGDFDETQPVRVSGNTTVTFDVPLPQVTGDTLFLGISHPDTGISLYINTNQVRKADAAVLVTLDQQVYEPGSSVTISAAPSVPGSLTLSAPGYSQTIQASGPVTQTFTIPENLPGGTYFVSWSFAPSSGSTAAGTVPFDVSGLRVQVVEASLEKGRYDSGDAIESRLRIHTNQPLAGVLQMFVLDPEGSTRPVGGVAIEVDPSADLFTTNTWPFTSTLAGLHRLVFGVYQDSSTVLASGSLAFDVGNGAVLGLRTDKTDYPLGTEGVQATVSAFVSGPADVHLELDGQAGPSEQVTSTGIVQIPLTPAGGTPGTHQLVAVMEGGGYTSQRTASFNYGTSLPDLVAGTPTGRVVNGGAWKIDVTVSNVGHSSAPATTLALEDQTAGAAVATVAVPALDAGGSIVVSADWNVQGLAGDRVVQATVDPGNGIVEFRKDNNVATATITVPSILVQAMASPSYAANTQASFSVSAFNLTPDKTFSGLVAAASILTPAGTVIPLPNAGFAPIGPGATGVASTGWAVATSAPGTYTLTVQVSDATSANVGTASAAFSVTQTYAFTGSVTAVPNPAQPQGGVTFSGHIQNQGNVDAAGTASFELLSGVTIAARYTTPATVAVGGSADLSLPVNALSAPPGTYQLDLRLSIGNQEYPVATSSFAVTGSPQAVLGVDRSPRVLAFVSPNEVGDITPKVDRVAFVQASLSGLTSKVVSDVLSFRRELRSGAWNTYLIVGKSVLNPDEQREAAFRGDGLVEVLWKAPLQAELESALGDRVQANLSGSNHTLTLLDGPLGPAQTVTVHRLAAQLTLTQASLAGTMDSGIPVLAVHAYGRGRAVTMAFDPAVPTTDPSRASLQALLLRSVNYAAPTVARPAVAGTVVPLAVTVTNSSTTSQNFDVTALLPSGVGIASVDDGPVQTGATSWTFTLAGGASRAVRFQVVLPDLGGTYAITSTVKIAGVPIANPPSFTLAVPTSYEASLSDTIVGLQSANVSSQDRPSLLAAIALLQVARCCGTGPVALDLRIIAAAEAGEPLGKIQSVDLSAARTAVDFVIAAYERAWYEGRVIQNSRLTVPTKSRPAVNAQETASEPIIPTASWRGSGRSPTMAP